MPKINEKKIIKNLILLFITVVFCLGFLEIILRVSGVGNINNESDFKFIKHATYSPFLIFGPNINKDVEQDNGEESHWNSQGFRLDYDLPLEKSENEYRIIALGGSTTEQYNGMNIHYPQEASKILNSDEEIDKDINIINSGKSAYSSAQSLIRLQFDILPFQPDMVTVMHNINDLNVNFFPYEDLRNNYANKYLYKNYANPYGPEDSFLRNMRVLTFGYQSLLNIKNNFFSNKVKTEEGDIINTMRYSDKPIELKSEEVFRNNLIAMAEIAKVHNIKLVLMSQPAIFKPENIALSFGHNSLMNKDILYPNDEDWQRLFEEYNSVIEEVANSQGVYFIDMYNLMGHDEKYFKDMVHYTSEGVEKFSEIYAQELKNIIK